MKTIITYFSLVIFLIVNSYSQTNYFNKVSEAYGYYYTGDYDKSLELFEEAFSSSTAKKRDILVAAYTAAYQEEESKALAYLQEYFELNANVFIDIESIYSHEVFKSYSHLPKWEEVFKKASESNSKVKPKLNLNLKRALDELYLLDQQTRDMSVIDSLVAVHGFPSKPTSDYLMKMNTQDKKNLARFKELVPVGTFPGISEVGVKGNLTAWLIIQHNSTVVQKEYLDALIKSAENGESDWSYVAGTIDRIMIEDEGVQLYGTQFGMDKNGKGFVKPIKDKENVNKRREELGLIAIEHDVKRHGIIYEN